jgi:hypothetical protein
MSTVEELLGRNSSGSGLEIGFTAAGDPPRWLRNTPLATNFADYGRSVGIVHSRTQAREFACFLFYVSLTGAREPETVH